MILQGIFNILELYSNQEDIFYKNIDKYFREKFNNDFNKTITNKESLPKLFKELISSITNELIKLGFDHHEIENKFSNHFLEIQKNEIEKINSKKDLYDKLAPIIYEIFSEKIIYYIANINVGPAILNLKSKGFLPIEFIIELENLKSLFKQSPEKTENLHKYIQIREKIIQKFHENKNNIEYLEDLQEPQKLQLLYLIYRIIAFFNIEKIFDFSHLKNYLKNNVNEWLDSLPLITLKNPDLYFCGIYLAKNLNIQLDEEKIKDFLLNLFEELIDEFEAPLIEATDQLYYFFKSTELVKVYIPIEQLNPLVYCEPKFFEASYLRNLETSQLVVILKIFFILNVYEKIDSNHINAIIEEIEHRITPEGIKQYRDGFVSSESAYYVIFLNYMRSTLIKLKDYDLLDNCVMRIYRNLEIISFSSETNYDLVSEIFYSCEGLKLLNCIETKEMIMHLAKYLFPQEIVDTISNNKEIGKSSAKFRHFKVSRITGETMLP